MQNYHGSPAPPGKPVLTFQAGDVIELLRGDPESPWWEVGSEIPSAWVEMGQGRPSIQASGPVGSSRPPSLLSPKPCPIPTLWGLMSTLTFRICWEGPSAQQLYPGPLSYGFWSSQISGLTQDQSWQV